MRYRIEKLGCYVLIVILLPYIVTIFLNGPILTSSVKAEEVMVKVKKENENYITMSLKDYGIGILAREISAAYEIEALKSQAIIIRTRIYKKYSENGSDIVLDEEFLTQSDMEEVWGIARFADNYRKLETAWKETEGQVLTYEGQIIYTPFFSLSNGTTRDGEEVFGKEYPYLKMKDCPLDIEETKQVQTVTLEKEEVDKLEIISCDTAGYVLKVKVGKEEINGEEFRQNYNLASSCFFVQEYEGKIRITTRGVGHGVGLSQNTAHRMAEEGKTANEILKYFYEGCEINEVADFVKNLE